MMAKRILFLIGLSLLCGCVKTKLNNTIPIVDVSNKSASSIRLFNFYDIGLDVSVNNVPLTSYASTSNQVGGGGTVLGLSIFPTGTWASQDDGAPFYLPSALLDKNGWAEVLTSPTSNLSYGSAPIHMDTTFVDDPSHPTDYYLLNDGHWRPQPRSATPPVDPTHFKIRVINLGAATDLENIVGSVTAVYADGSLVDDRLANVAPGQTTDYVELPYGSYGFKLFVAQGGAIDPTRQLAELPLVPNYNPCTNTVQLQEGIFSRVRTFKPGGVYTIVVSQNMYTMFVCDKTTSGPRYFNSYRIVTDVDPGTNATYAHVQAVNALPGGAVTVTVDGQPLGDALPYIGSTPADVTQHANYSTLIKGNHRVEAVDAEGTVLASATLTLYPYDNYSIWVYPTPEGKPALLFESNDMTGSVYAQYYVINGQPGVIDDGTNGTPRRHTYNYALETRFLNLTTDVPFLTCTGGDQLLLPALGGQEDSLRPYSAYTNLMPGVLPAINPDLIYNLEYVSPWQSLVPNGSGEELGSIPSQLRAYLSVPGPYPELPGTWLSGIPPLNLQKTWVANPALYSAGQLPSAESGIYNIALVGKLADGSARYVLIKLNK